MRRPLLIGLIAVGATAVALPPVQAASPSDPITTGTVLWEMDEGSGSSVMLDSGPNGINGGVDTTGVVTGYTVNGATGYHWERRAPELAPASPERVIQVPDNVMLDAGSDTFTLEIRYRTKEKFGNIIQKGQSASKGGQWKIQNPKGIPSCLFKGPGGRVATGAKTPLNDNQWHVLTCVKTPTRVTMYVDGVYRNKKNGTTGTIDNKIPVTIGGKINCDQIKTTCDYFSGEIDYVRIDHS